MRRRDDDATRLARDHAAETRRVVAEECTRIAASCTTSSPTVSSFIAGEVGAYLLLSLAQTLIVLTAGVCCARPFGLIRE